MKIFALQHVAFETVGLIADWANARGYSLTICKLYAREPLPRLDTFDMLVVMGGPMGVADEKEYVWLSLEKQLIKTAIDAGKIVLGICLGAQLIASVLGARVYQNSVKEIGWHPVAKVDEVRHHPFLYGIPDSLNVFHWHGDTFDMPKDATLLMSSDTCKHQAFVYNDKVIGLQFHLEMTQDGIRNMIVHCRSEIIPSTTIQPEEKLVSGATAIPDCQCTLYALLDRLCA